MPLIPASTALAGAFLIAIGFVLQQHAAALMPPQERLTFRLLVHLARQPVWLTGIGCMVGGQILGAVALGTGSLALVEPIMATNLLFALPISAAWHRRRIRWSDAMSAGAVIAGLAMFVVAGDPSGGGAVAHPRSGLPVATGAVLAALVLLVFGGRRVHRRREASLLASAAGVGYGLQDALTRRTELQLGHSVIAALTSWPVFALVAVAVVALLLNQSAFEAGPLSLSLPPVTVGEPLTGVAIGVGVYGEHLNLAWTSLAGEVIGLAAMLAGVVWLARSPLVTDPRGGATSGSGRLAGISAGETNGAG